MPSGLELYPHNEKAYRKLLDMLSGTRRACIIPAVRDELLARRGYAKEIRNRYASAVPDYGEDNVRAAGQAGTHSVQHPVIESGRTREQSDRNVEH